MGIPGLVWYGEDIGSAIEHIEKIIATIKTNKFDKQDIVDLVKANNVLVASLVENED
jgi:hypothetical protein